MTRPTTAIILAGGKGTRLRPLTNAIPKSLLPVQGKPILEHIIALFQRHGVQEIVLVVGYRAKQIRAYFGNGDARGVTIRYSKEDKPGGVTHALYLTRSYVQKSFFVSNGDELKNIDLDAMYTLHKREGALATLAISTVEDPSPFGMVMLYENKIVSFIEKPSKKEAQSHFVSAGLYLVEPEIFNYFTAEGETSLEKNIFPVLATQGKLAGFLFPGQWFPIDTLELYKKASREWEAFRSK